MIWWGTLRQPMPMIPDISFGVLGKNDVCNIHKSMHHLRKVAVAAIDGSAAVEATVMTTAAAAIPELRAEAVLWT